MWEVFDPRNGTPIVTVRSRWIARVIAEIYGLDYAQVGEGW